MVNIIPLNVPSNYDLDLELRLQTAVETGEIEGCPELVLELQRVEFENQNPYALTPNQYERVLQELKTDYQMVVNTANELRDLLDYQADSQPIPLSGSRQAIRDCLAQLSCRNRLLELTDRYKTSIPQKVDQLCTLFLSQGIRYCIDFVRRNADWDFLVKQHREIPKELFPRYLERIYQYLNQLPYLYLVLAKRVVDSLLKQVPPIDRPAPSESSTLNFFAGV